MSRRPRPTGCNPWAYPLAAAGEGLALLAAHLFVLVADALALVRLRLAHAAHLGRELPHLLLVRPADDDRGRVRQLHGHTLGRRHLNRVGVADRQHQVLLVQARLVADTLDLEALLVALGNAL